MSHKSEIKQSRKKMVAAKMHGSKDSDVLREFSRYDKEKRKPIFKYPEGTYKNVKGRYTLQPEEKYKENDYGTIM